MIYQLGNLARMLKVQWRPASDLRELQNRKLRSLILHAYRQVPFYRRLFDSRGLKPEDIRRVEDLSQLPTISKGQLRAAPAEEVIACGLDPSKCVEVRTSGSTGLPLKLYYRRKDDSRLNVSWLRPLFAHGVRPWYRKLEISGLHNLPSGKKWYQHLGIWRREGISIFLSPGEWVKAWRRYRPEILYGYSGSLKLLARHVLDAGLDDIRPCFVFGVSDLADEECRELIQSAFSRSIIDLYGAAEAGCIAWECPRCQEYHINADTVIVEFLRDGRPVPPGSPGRVVVTNLHSFAMPIIRYELGDIGVPGGEKLSCGRGLPLMKVIEGRDDAFIVLPSGKLLSPMFFFGTMKKIKGINQWKVFQSDLGCLKILIVPSENSSSETIDHLRKRVEENSGEKMEIEVELVENIPGDSSGKVRAVVSQLESPF